MTKTPHKSPHIRQKRCFMYRSAGSSYHIHWIIICVVYIWLYNHLYQTCMKHTLKWREWSLMVWAARNDHSGLLTNQLNWVSQEKVSHPAW